jgi:hypothetical protein
VKAFVKLFFCVVWILGVTQFIHAQPDSYVYAYMAISQFGDAAEIMLVNPREATVESQPFPLPEGLIFSPRLKSLISPDVRWIASTLFAVDQSRIVIHLFNIEKQLEYEVAEGFVANYGKNLAWSQDSRYLAINIRLLNHNGINLYLYNIEKNELMKASIGTPLQREIAWSDDNTQLVTFSRPCLPDNACPDSLVLLDAASGREIASASLAELPFLGNSACDPKFSPTRRYVSFVSNCGYGVPFSYDFSNEIYIWHIEERALVKITDYAEGQANSSFQAKYNHAWLDDQTLLIGVNYRNGTDPEQQRLATYDFIGKMASTLSSEVGAAFEIDKTSGDIIFLPHLVFSDQPHKSEALLRLSNLSSISTLREHSLSIPHTCEAGFSPTGDLVAVITSKRACSLFIDGITFINSDASIIQAFPVETDKSYRVGLGWIKHSGR